VLHEPLTHASVVGIECDADEFNRIPTFTGGVIVPRSTAVED
jgi:hypothetical protein